MAIDSPANPYDGEVAALQQLRKMESLNASAVSTALSNVAEIADQFGIPGAGLFAKALRSGQTPVEKVVEQLESGACKEIARIWKHLREHDAQYEEHFKDFETRLQSQEAQSVYLSGVFHALRTSDPKKHLLLGRLSINCVFANELSPESLDGMMRAAVELKETDIGLLGRIYESQKQVVQQSPSLFSHQWCERVIAYWEHDFAREQRDHLAIRGSLSRLQSAGLIVEVRTMAPPDGSLAHQPFGLLPEGAKFCERLQDLSVKE